MRSDASLAARALPLLMWGLTFHILAIAVLFGLVRLPLEVVRGIASWKEIVGLGIFTVVCVRMIAGRGPRVHISLPDMFAAGWVGTAIVLALTENVVLRDSIPLQGALFGVRDAAFFVIFYFVGRATPEIAAPALFRRAFAILLVTCAIAVAEQLFVTPQMLVAMGVASYAQDFLGGDVFTRGNPYGLPDNYWSQMGSHLVRRSGSVFLSSQGFALIFLVLMPAATIAMLDADTRRRVRWYVGYTVIWVGLIVTFTRTAIAVGALQLLVLLAIRRRVTGVALAAALGTGLFLAAIAAFPSFGTFVLQTLTWQSGSSASHLKDYVNGITAFLEQPWGHGLGTTDQTAVRAGLKPLTADNLYLKYAVEMGALGLVLVVGTLGTLADAGRQLMSSGATESERQLGQTVVLAVVGVAIYGMTSTIFNDPLVSYVLFWIGGAAVTLSQRLPAPRLALAAAPDPAHA